MLFSRPLLSLLLLARGGVFDWRPVVGRSVWCCLSGALNHLLAAPWLTDSLLTASWECLKTEIARISRGYLIYHFITPTHFRSTTWPLPLILTYTCLCLLSDRTWHKVNVPKVDYSEDLEEGNVGHEPRLEPCWTMLVIGPLSAMCAWWASLVMDSNLDLGSYSWL